ncbi:MAG: hypothetical protein J0L78_12505 [Planctomycetes bacterium]|nr:hypothetical protein [Planctomycetota bacterium]
MKDREEVSPVADFEDARPRGGTVKLEPLTLGANMGHATDDFRLAVRSSESARAVHEEEVDRPAGTERRRRPGAGV